MSGAISVVGPSGPLRVVSMRLLVPLVGVWIADLEIDPLLVAMAPTSGPVQIIVGDPTPILTLRGTVDPRGSGSFVGVSDMRVLAGGAGWDQTVPAQHFHSDAGLSSAQVYTTTAALVKEVVAVSAPRLLGPDFVRTMGPASRVLEAEPSWWVDFTGVTQVGPRPTPLADPSMQLLSWDPTLQAAELACDTAVLPGTLINDARAPGGPFTIRDVEQRFDATGSHVTAWCSIAPVSQLVNDLRALILELSGQRFLRSYLYRIALQNGSDGRLQLQAVHPTAGVPDTLPLAPWTGLSGAKTTFLLGSLARVSFLEGDPTQPVVDLYQPGALPLESTVDASAALHLGPTAPLVQLAGGGHPVAFADLVLTELVKIATAIGSLGGTYVPPVTPPGSVKVSSA